MKITFQSVQQEQNQIERQKETRKDGTIQKIGYENGAGSGYMLDISGTPSGSEIYGEPGKTAADVMQEAGTKNMDVISDYMAVMSNTMSDEEFGKLQEDGYRIGDMEVEEAVTIVDEIKASLLKAGVSVSGYTDTLDMDTLTEITGDAGLARELAQTFSEKGVPLTEETAREAVEALKEAQALRQPGDDTVKYMVNHDREPVLEELYRAQYSSLKDGSRQGRGYYQDENGYLTKRADNINWDSLQPQIDRILKEAGLDGAEGAEASAKWLIGAGIPLTEKTLSSYMELQKISVPMEQNDLLSAMAMAVSDGKSPRQASLTGAKSLWEQAYDIWNRTQQITETAADLAAQQEGELTLAGLDAAQRLLDSGYHNVTQENAAARRQLEEIRLQMTITANRELLKSGYTIETAELEEVIQALKDVEYQQNRILFGGETPADVTARSQLYRETVDTVREIPRMPAAVIGKISSEKADYNLKEVKESGEALAASYKKANESYETLQTAPRRDMGDSITKAFRNIEELLEEIGLETSDANKRAVRILGYNSLEITEENIMTVKAADEALRGVVRKLTPAAALEMIREGKNPLEMTVSELDDYLNDRQQDPEREQEKFSKFLYKLEQKKEITEEEKDSYIGIYRLLRQVEKSDGAVIGSLLHQGTTLSFKNLLTQIRISRAKGIDKTVDDDLGTLQEVRKRGEAIDDQIGRAFANRNDTPEQDYYTRLNREIYNTVDGDTIAQIGPDEETDLETFAEQLRQAQPDEELEASWRSVQREEYRQIRPDSAAADMLRMMGEALTPDNIRAVHEYRKDSDGVFKKMRKGADKQTGESEKSLEVDISRLEERFTDREEATRAYRDLVETEKGILDDAMYDSEHINSVDVRELGLLYKQISFSAKLAETERYDIPLLTEDSVVALHVEIIHSQENKGSVEASMDTGRYGKLSIRLHVQDHVVTGFFIGSQEEKGAEIENLKDKVKAELSRMGFETETMATGFRSDLKTGFSSERMQKEESTASTGELYRIAKATIVTIHREIERGSSHEN